MRLVTFDFPAPEGPTSLIISPARSSNEISRSIWRTPSYANETFSNSTFPRTGSRCWTISGSMSSKSKTRWAELVARLRTTGIRESMSIG